jgi:hypothetical protein
MVLFLQRVALVAPSQALNESENLAQAGDFPLQAVVDLTNSLHILHTLSSDDDFEHVGYISEGEEYSNSEYYSTFGYQEAEGLYSVDEE